MKSLLFSQNTFFPRLPVKDKLTVSGEQNFSFTFGSTNRSYIVYVPATYDGTKSFPAVLNFHGGGGSAKNQIQTSQMNKVADTNNFLVVYPEGTPNKLGDAHRTWNAIGCCGNAVEDKIDDIGAVRALLSDLNKHFKIDQKRIFATGHSNGAMMVEVLGCTLSDKIAAIGSNAGGLYYPDCKPVRPVSVILFHGTGDTAYPYEGGKITFDTLKNKPDYPSAKDDALNWATRNACNLNPVITLQKGGASCETYAGCQSNTSVTLCSLDGNGHTWPGGQDVGGDSSSWLVKLTQKIVGTVNQDISASEEMWKFFSAHPLP